MRKFLIPVFALCMVIGLTACGKKGDSSLLGRWYGVDKNQDMEFRADGTFLSYKHGSDEPSNQGTYEIEKDNIARLTSESDDHRIAYHVSDDGELLTYAFTQDVMGRPVSAENLYYIYLVREEPRPAEAE